METRSEYLARVQRERKKTTEGGSDCKERRGRAMEVNGAFTVLYAPGGKGRGAR